MENSKKILIGVAIIIVIIFLYGLSVYNGLISSNESVNGQWAQVETQYQRRLDLIPNVVNAVKGIMNQEQAIFGEISAARANYAGAQTVDGKVKAANEVEGSFSRLLAIMENYPQLKSSENVQSLIVELEGAENRVSVERKRFNDAVLAYNLIAKRFPSGIIAGIFGFSEKTYFESISGAETAPKVEL